MKIALRAILIVSAVAGFLTCSVVASSQPAFKITPTKLDVSTVPGHSVSGVFQIANKSKQAVKIKVYALDLISTLEGTSYGLLPKSNKDSAARWFSFKPSLALVEAGRKRNIRYIVKYPLGVRADTYNAIVLFQPVFSKSKSGGSKVVVSGQIGAITKVEVLPLTRGKVSSFSFPYLANSKEVSFATDITNVGSTRLRPKGTIKIKDWLGKKVGAFRYPWAELGYGEGKQIEVKWNKAPWFGFYTAQATIDDGSGNRPKELQAKFLVFPWKISLIFLGMLLLTSATWFFFLKARQKGRALNHDGSGRET